MLFIFHYIFLRLAKQSQFTECRVFHKTTRDRQHRGFIIPQAVTHSIAHLKMGKTLARNMLS